MEYRKLLFQMSDRLRTEARKVDIDEMEHLKRVNGLLAQFNFHLLHLPEGTVAIGDVRKLFSEKAAACIEQIEDSFGVMDREGKEWAAWTAVCSSNVFSSANTILYQWDRLLGVMARKQHMTKEMLIRDFHEKSLGL